MKIYNVLYLTAVKHEYVRAAERVSYYDAVQQMITQVDGFSLKDATAA